MTSLRERMQVGLSEVEEAQKHNAQISENYRKLANVWEQLDVATEETKTEEQQAEEAVQEQNVVEEAPLYISPSNVSAFEQTPRMTEYVSPTAASVFTTQKFEAIKPYEEEMRVAAPVEMATPKTVTETAVEARYGLTPFAKVVMAVFTFVVIAMLSMICINTQIIRQKSIRIKNLEEKKEQLLEQYDEIQRRIETAQSEEAIRAYAEANGMVIAGN